jgi:hypothetical protein
MDSVSISISASGSVAPEKVDELRAKFTDYTNGLAADLAVSASFYPSPVAEAAAGQAQEQQAP